MANPETAEPAVKEARRIDVASITARIVGNIEKVIIGKRPQISLALVAYFCEGHILLEDVPGVAKTMAARRVTVDGQTYALKPPFLVIATQNPIDHEGTFPLPEAQLDRFLVRLTLGYPGLEEESKMLQRLQHGHPIDDLAPVVSAAEVVACQDAIREVHVDEKIRRYLLDIVQRTREHDDVHLGGSPRE